MNNCLVTKLKTVVDNDNLKYFNCIVLDIQDPAILYQVSAEEVTYGIYLKFDSNSTIYIEGDGYFTDATQSTNLGKTLNISGNTGTNVYFSAGTNYKCIVQNKYNLLEIGNISGESRLYKAYGFLASDLAYCTKLQKINVLSCLRVIGDILEFGTCLNLTNLLGGEGTNAVGPSGLYGRVELMMQKMAENGRISEKMHMIFIQGNNPNITYAGGASWNSSTEVEFISNSSFKVYGTLKIDTWTKTNGVWNCSTESVEQ